jgi:hypothetical protein
MERGALRAIALALMLTACATAPPPPSIDVSAPDAALIAQQNGGRHVCVTGDLVVNAMGAYYQLPHNTPPGWVAPNSRRIYVSARTPVLRRQIVDHGAIQQTICGTLIVDQYHGDSDLFHLVVHRRG